MSVVVDNLFSRDTYATRTERLIAIQGNFAAVQPFLNAPAEIADWAEDCKDVFTDLLAVADVEKNESESATIVVADAEALLEEEYQNARTLAKSIFVDEPKLYEQFSFTEIFPDKRDDKYNRVKSILTTYQRFVADGTSPNLPATVMNRLIDARDDFDDALVLQDKERGEAGVAQASLSDRFVSDSKMLNKLKSWWFAMMGKKDPRITWIGMVNPDYSGSGSTPTPVPPAPTNLVYHSEVPSITWDPVVGATSYEVQHKTDASTEWNIIYTGTDNNLLHADPPGDYNVRMRARNDGGFGEFSSILNYSVGPIQPD